MIMNKQQADAFCAIVALGFIGQNQQSFYLYDDPGDNAQHDQLAQILRNKFGINIAPQLQNAKDAITGKKVHPFIYALPYGNPGEARQLTYNDVDQYKPEVLPIVQLAEDEINKSISPTNKFRGAYIGGFIDFSRNLISLLGPSSLYLRNRVFLTRDEPSPNVMVESLIDYSHVTKELKIFLKDTASSLYVNGEIIDGIVVSPDLTDELISEVSSGGDIDVMNGKLISSCHGLVTSMYYHSDVSPTHLDDGVCIELSLSENTCKSASCIPCAIFAASQGAPASAVHFGRGDYWNLPADELRRNKLEIEDNWRSFVAACFTSASREILDSQRTFNPNTVSIAQLSYNLDEVERIPEMFLDALTFEGSFINKIIDSLG